MKRITAIIIVAAAVIGSSYVGAAQAADAAKPVNCDTIGKAVAENNGFTNPAYFPGFVNACRAGEEKFKMGYKKDFFLKATAESIAEAVDKYPDQRKMATATGIAIQAGYFGAESNVKEARGDYK